MYFSVDVYFVVLIPIVSIIILGILTVITPFQQKKQVLDK